ncbi:Tyrosine-protein kinase, partial [Trichostrongylus colubriformis]
SCTIAVEDVKNVRNGQALKEKKLPKDLDVCATQELIPTEVLSKKLPSESKSKAVTVKADEETTVEMTREVSTVEPDQTTVEPDATTEKTREFGKKPAQSTSDKAIGMIARALENGVDPKSVAVSGEKKSGTDRFRKSVREPTKKSTREPRSKKSSIDRISKTSIKELSNSREWLKQAAREWSFSREKGVPLEKLRRGSSVSREPVRRSSGEFSSSKEKSRERMSTHSLRGNSTRSLKERPINKMNLEDQIYYHGYRPRKDVMGLMKEPGDFLIRATDSGHLPRYVISILNDKREVINLALRRKNGLPIPRFTQIDDLVEYYSRHRLPGNARLRHVIPRPSWLIKSENVVFDRKKDLLGTGNFCHVYRGIYYRTPEQKVKVAIKIAHEGHGSDKSFEETKEARAQLLEEAKMMSYYVHSHIVEMYGVACDHPPVLIVMEYCPGGSLEYHLRAQKELIEIGERIVYALEVVLILLFSMVNMAMPMLKKILGWIDMA